jgi:hypothetical protein
MKRFIVALFITVPLLAQERPAPTITSLDPAVGPSTGGTSVTITGTHIGTPPGFACLVPCPPVVRFGAREVQAAEQNESTLTVTTPAHEPGTVDVTVRTPDGRSVTAENAFTFSPFEEAGSERVLLPVYLDGIVNGVNGSQWATDFWIRNHGNDPVTIAQWPCVAEVCTPVIPQTRTLEAGQTLHNLPPFFRPPSSNVGRLLHVFPPATVSMNLRVFDRSRAAIDAGTQVPIVRERDLLTATAHLLSVPVDSRFRLMLRIYEATPIASQYRVRIYSQDAGTNPDVLLSTMELTAVTEGEPGMYAVYPAYADAAVEIAAQESGLARMEIEPLTPKARFWAVVSVTNNDTQRVTLVTP